ncbi:MAG: M23 family metallopeptidase [Rhodobiaceae bacterium]|nr:M23 family metallopeptidase [Rhodobiaceae bacterium]
MQNSQFETSRFEGLMKKASLAGEAFGRFAKRLNASIPASAGTDFSRIGSMGYRGRWGTATTAVAALTLGMGALAIGSLVSPQTRTDVSESVGKASVRVVTTMPLLAAQPETPEPVEAETETASLFSNPFAEEVAEPVSAAPLSFGAAYSFVTESIRRTATETVSVGRGDTLMGLLTESGAARADAHRAIAAMTPLQDPRKVRAGQELELAFEEYVTKTEEGESEISRRLTTVSMKTDVDRHVTVSRTDEGDYAGMEVIAELETGHVQARGTINSSLFLAAADAGIPAAITVEMIRMYSYDIDFQREIRQGDTFEVFFTREYDEDGTPVREGDVLYASMNVRGKERRLWRHEPSDGGNWDYFDEQGRSMRKFLMKTPIDGARISSSFGNRRHPILGYTRLHAGTDFAAPSGTPIYAAGSGTIEMAQRNGSFGNYVRIRHANGYQTAYAHMRGYGRGIRKGVRVRQGQVIGYVGTTGRSTGPHLHYEVIHNGNKVNPQRIRVPTGRTLSGQQLAAFQEARTNINTMMAEAPSMTQMAEAELTSDADETSSQ